MALQAIYEKQDEVPEAHRELYTERDGKWECTGIEGFRTQADVDRLQESLNKERKDHKAAKDAFTPWTEMNHEETVASLARIPELEAAAEAKDGKVDQTKLEELADARAKTRLAPLERQVVDLTKSNEDKDVLLTDFQSKELRRTIHDSVRTAMVESKVVNTAHDDVLMLAERMFEVTEDDKVLVKDDVGSLPGGTPADWLRDMQEKRPHWWPPSQGGGAAGSGGGGATGAKNPWQAENWSLTAQGAYLKEHGREKADQAAKMAGVHFGATHPALKKAS